MDLFGYNIDLHNVMFFFAGAPFWIPIGMYLHALLGKKETVFSKSGIIFVRFALAVIIVVAWSNATFSGQTLSTWLNVFMGVILTAVFLPTIDLEKLKVVRDIWKNRK